MCNSSNSTWFEMFAVCLLHKHWNSGLFQCHLRNNGQCCYGYRYSFSYVKRPICLHWPFRSHYVIPHLMVMAFQWIHKHFDSLCIAMFWVLKSHRNSVTRNAYKTTYLTSDFRCLMFSERNATKCQKMVSATEQTVLMWKGQTVMPSIKIVL